MFGKLIRVIVRALAALVLVIIVAITMLMPPTAQPLANADWTASAPVVRGAYHIHSQRSDGSATVEEIAAIAAAEKLDFIIFTDHGDGTRTPDPPTYRSGVLCIDGVEVSTSAGHYVALGLPAATPYALGGSPRSVVEDVARLGGFGIVAHPDSAKPELRWSDWETDFNGIEWLNADSEWRDESYAALGRLILTYWFRPVETLAFAIDRPVTTIERWDGLVQRRRVPALAGADAHARIGRSTRTDGDEERAVARTPSYGVSFRTFHNNIILDAPFTHDAPQDAARLLQAIGEGRVFSTIDGLAPAGPFEFVAHSGAATARIGEYLDAAGPVVIEGRVAAPADAAVLVLRDSVPVHLTKASQFRIDVGGQPGAYRVEVRLAGKPPVPWLLTNPIYVGLRERHRAALAPYTRPPATMVRELSLAGVQTEADPRSTSTLTSGAVDSPAPIGWSYRISDGVPSGQYAALRIPASGLGDVDRLTFRVSADQPMRAWLQLRAPAASLADGERWGASFYADSTEREVTVFVDELTSLGVTSSAQPALERIDSILVVADTVNSRPGASNTLRLVRASLGGSKDPPLPKY